MLTLTRPAEAATTWWCVCSISGKQQSIWPAKSLFHVTWALALFGQTQSALWLVEDFFLYDEIPPGALGSGKKSFFDVWETVMLAKAPAKTAILSFSCPPAKMSSEGVVGASVIIRDRKLCFVQPISGASCFFNRWIGKIFQIIHLLLLFKLLSLPVCSKTDYTLFRIKTSPLPWLYWQARLLLKAHY